MNDWNQKHHRMIEKEKGVYSITLLLKPDEYHYKFLEDGINWITDINSINFVDDGFGGKNSVILVNDNFKKVKIKKSDGLVLEYGITTSQNSETINLLSPKKIEFKTKAHLNDVESVYLKIDEKQIQMEKIATDEI